MVIPLSAYVHPIGSTGDHTIDARATVVATAGGIVTAAVLADVATAPTRFFLCASRTDQGEAELWRYSEPTFTDLGASSNGGGTDLRLVLRAATGNEICRVNGAQVTSGNAVVGGGNVGVRARNMTARFTSVAIYRSP